MKAFAYTALIAASLLGAAAHADQGNNYGNDFPPPGISATHELSRAQVLAELAQAKANGGIVYGREDLASAPLQQAGQSVDRARVQQELKEFRLSHRVTVPGDEPAAL
ncbi:hypothetical protein PIGHUM_03064 [Pigmentiphaga humi]|uniref:DUF4148 domain-containing protein n=1 Tax=Pigmentiphaga humi TaxID=2478468 RepID=A0A3P4B3V7_9BURK|nr:DUF4148 domain-containing protein [Pigmentiphaga humi]VCU70984.1 hypothetical protein PIGHUM_03064 [Pigmentiphaga humi]